MPKPKPPEHRAFSLPKIGLGADRAKWTELRRAIDAERFAAGLPPITAYDLVMQIIQEALDSRLNP